MGSAALPLCMPQNGPYYPSTGLIITPAAIEEEDGGVGLGLVVELVNLSTWNKKNDRGKHLQQHRPSSSNVQMTSMSRLSGMSMTSKEQQHRASNASNNHSSVMSQSISMGGGGGGGPSDSGHSPGDLSLVGRKGGLKSHSRSDLSAPPSPSLSNSAPISLLATVTIDTRDGSGTVVVEQVGVSLCRPPPN